MFSDDDIFKVIGILPNSFLLLQQVKDEKTMKTSIARVKQLEEE